MSNYFYFNKICYLKTKWILVFLFFTFYFEVNSQSEFKPNAKLTPIEIYNEKQKN